MKLIANRKALQKNLAAIAGYLNNHKIEMMGVIKGVCGNRHMIDLFLEAGFLRFGESRLFNLKKLRTYYGDRVCLYLIRPPSINEVAETVRVRMAHFIAGWRPLKR